MSPSFIEEIRAGKRDAFKQLYEQYSTKIFLIAKKFGLSKEDAEGIVQEVFIRLWNSRKKINKDLSLNAYIITITKNCIYKTLKKSMRMTFVSSFADEGDNSTEAGILYHDLLSHAASLIEKLPSKQKEIFRLYSTTGLNAVEIAERLHISQRTVENQIYKAKLRLRQDLSKASVIIPLLLMTF